MQRHQDVVHQPFTGPTLTRWVPLPLLADKNRLIGPDNRTNVLCSNDCGTCAYKVSRKPEMPLVSLTLTTVDTHDETIIFKRLDCELPDITRDPAQPSVLRNVLKELPPPQNVRGSRRREPYWGYP